MTPTRISFLAVIIAVASLVVSGCGLSFNPDLPSAKGDSSKNSTDDIDVSLGTPGEGASSGSGGSSAQGGASPCMDGGGGAAGAPSNEDCGLRTP